MPSHPAISDNTAPLPISSLPVKSQDLLSALAEEAERGWKDFALSTNGQVLLQSPEIPDGERVKNAFIFGSIAAQTSSVAAFIQNGLNAHLLPHRRIVWRGVDHIGLAEGQAMASLLFLAQYENDPQTYIFQGWAKCEVPHPELGAQVPLTPKPVVSFYTDLGGNGQREIKGVVAWVTLEEVIKTFVR